MDYTTSDRVKLEIHATLSYDDILLGKLVTAASRAIDRKCTGVPDAVDYFASGSPVIGEVLEGWIDNIGKSILCHPHKPVVTSVSYFGYQQTIVDPLYTVDPSRIEAGGPTVKAYPVNLSFYPPAKVRVTINYTGGLASTTDGLPDDLQELTAILAARFYREAETGLQDQMGVAELATMVYTKAWPVRVMEQIQPFIRRVGWRHLA